MALESFVWHVRQRYAMAPTVHTLVQGEPARPRPRHESTYAAKHCSLPPSADSNSSSDARRPLSTESSQKGSGDHAAALRSAMLCYAVVLNRQGTSGKPQGKFSNPVTLLRFV
jgi:hypothetical protein